VLLTSSSEPPLLAAKAPTESVVELPRLVKAPKSAAAAEGKRNPPVEWARVVAVTQHSAAAAVAAQVALAAQP